MPVCLDRDCDINDAASCLSSCSAGFTGFPKCQDYCPPQCAACGGSYLNSSLPSTECIVCTDPGAVPPACNTCLPYVCVGFSGACDTPCERTTIGVECSSSAAIGAGESTTLSLTEYEFCDDCTAMLGFFTSALQLSAKLQQDLSEAEKAAASMEEMCMWIAVVPVIGEVTGFFCEAGVVGIEGEAVVQFLASAALEWLLERTSCVSMQLCPPPCTASRDAKLKAMEVKAPFKV